MIHQSISSNIDYRQKKYPHTTEWLMENTMCSSSDDVDDEDYVKKWKTQCVLPLMMVMTKTMWKNEKMENTMCSST